MPKSTSLNLKHSHPLEDWLLARSKQTSVIFPGHSSHFERFPPKVITVPEGNSADYLGNLWPVKFGHDSERAGKYRTSIPALSEDYFEIIDIFEATLDAERVFTMLEWGAGFARWTSFAVAAARALGIRKFNLGCVEAHPLHIRYIEENFTLANISANQATIYPFALNTKSGTDVFLIEMPSDTPLDVPDGVNWYGQALNSFNDLKPNGKFYEGSPILENERGWQGIEVPVEPASSVLRNYGFIDLIDMDLQGVEANVVDECIDQLDNQARRLHIGTHGAEIEQRLRQTLSAHGWILLRDLAVAATTDTCFGPVTCIDGVQSWFNPRFPPPGWEE